MEPLKSYLHGKEINKNTGFGLDNYIYVKVIVKEGF